MDLSDSNLEEDMNVSSICVGDVENQERNEFNNLSGEFAWIRRDAIIRFQGCMADGKLKRKRKYESATLSPPKNKNRCLDIFYATLLFGWLLFFLVNYIMKWKTGKSNGLIDVIDYFTFCGATFGIVFSWRYWLVDFEYLWEQMCVVYPAHLRSDGVQSRTAKVFPRIARFLTTLRYISPLLFVFAFPLFDNWWYWMASILVSGFGFNLLYGPYYSPIIVQCMVCYQYSLHLTKLAQGIGERELTDIVRDYKRMYSSFRKVYTSNLRWAIGGVLIFHWSFFLFFFVKREHGMYFNIKAPHLFDAEATAMMFLVNAFVFMILYSLSGLVLSNAFGKFQAKLWKVVEESNDDEFASAMSMVSYSKKSPIVVDFIYRLF